LGTGFIGHFNTRLVKTLNYSAIADLHTLQITTAHAKSFPVCSVFTRRFPVTASNSGHSSTASIKPSLHRLPYNSDELDSDSEAYVTTDGQSASLSWNKALIWGLRLDFYYCQTIAGLLLWSALSDERTGLSFTNAAGPRPRSHSQVRVPWDHILVSQIRDSPNLEGPPGRGWPGCTPRH
jgi:hypothetical protein